MKYFFIPLLIFVVSCVSSSQSSPPPGVERGQIWKFSELYGYEEPVYSTPDLLPKPEKGTSAVLKTIRETLDNTPCRNIKSILFMTVVDEAGKVMAVHPTPPSGFPCEEDAIEEIKSYRFYPAEYEGKKVLSIVSFRVSFR